MVRRTPLVPMGSLVACTSTSSPRLSSSAIWRLRLGTPMATTSSTCRKPFFSRPISMNAASMPASTFSTRPFHT